MKNSLDHLPASKRHHLAKMTAIIREEFDKVTSFKVGKKRHSRIVKIILFGSYATGKWVYKPGYGYISDYDILIILNNRDLVDDYKLWDIIEDRIALIWGPPGDVTGSYFRPPLNLIVHSLEFVNDALGKSQYFFTDIKKEGVVLYENSKRPLSQPYILPPEDYLPIAKDHYNMWFKSAKSFLIDHVHCMERKDYNKASFELHQAAERFYACIILVLTNYKKNTHNLKHLNFLAIKEDARVAEAFPWNRKLNRKRFYLLKDAYIDSRYSQHFKISKTELEWLYSRVEVLRDITKKICREKIRELEA
ncbi:MAG: HEPN domain-containing protein [Candidatus Margulisbacteria bacterium]|nr:HEPN domain-containing protein [Candidatus Margulisiibacteriota bacterium]